MDNLIFDRLASDVDNALNNPNSSYNLKGAYNCSDLNRVEAWCEYLQYVLSQYGFTEKLVIKKDWNFRDYPTRTEIDRIRSNIDTLKEFCYAINTEEIIYNNTLNFEQANILEKVLYDIQQHVIDNTYEVPLSYNFATALAKKRDIELIADNRKNLKEPKLDIGIGVFLYRTSFFSLQTY